MPGEVDKIEQNYDEFNQRIAEYRTTFELNLTKERQLKRQFEQFYKSDENQIRDFFNRVMLSCEKANLE